MSFATAISCTFGSRSKAILLGCFALALSGCQDLTTPDRTVRSAYDAVLRGNLKDLRSTLAGAALDHYGTDVGLKELQSRLGPSSGVQQIYPYAPTLTHYVKDDCEYDVEHTYDTDVYAQKQSYAKLLIVRTTCSVDYIFRSELTYDCSPFQPYPRNGSNMDEWPTAPNYPTCTLPLTPTDAPSEIPCGYEQVFDCRITGLTF